MIQKYTENPSHASVRFSQVVLFLMLVFTTLSFAQNTYTLGTGTQSTETLGVSPFATINSDSRSQYLILAQELIDAGAISGNIVSLAINVTSLAEPSTLKPKNVSVKLGMTGSVSLGTTLVEGLPTYYASASEDIVATGWHTINFATPFEWDGQSNIIVEFCRANDTFGTSFGVQTSIYNIEDYRTIGLYSNLSGTAGCDLTGTSPMTNSNRRIRPNFRVTMTMPCDGTPSPGDTVVTDGPYCSGAPFTLSVVNGAIESGLYYQWQQSPNGNGLWEDIAGANNTTYTTTQSTATFYRRATTCLESQQTINSLAVFVDGEGCYCNAQVLTENEIGITNVSFSNLANNSESDVLYSNFTGLAAVVNRGSTFDLSARVSTAGGTSVTRAWIDWNKNSEFEDSESYDLGSVTGGSDVASGTNASIVVPNDAVIGITKMRIRTAQPAVDAIPACGPVENGETEDYSVNVLDVLGTPTNNISADLAIFASGSDAIVALTSGEIRTIKVYDLSGRLLAHKKDVNGSNVSVAGLNVSGQILIFRVGTADGKTIIKKAIF